MRSHASNQDKGELHVDYTQGAYRLLAESLPRLGEPALVREDGVWLTNWPSIRISAGHLLVSRSPPEQEAWTAWLDLTLMYNTWRPETAAATHVIGLGGDGMSALANAVEQWIAGVAPALISHIYGELTFGADYWPDGDPRGIAGWNCICGPYILRGGDSLLKGEAGRLLQEHPLHDPTRSLLGDQLDLNARMHTVSLYRATMEDTVHADVLIDNQQNPEAGELLRRAAWLGQPKATGFLSVRHFLLCLKRQGSKA
jgi:hypothetical protein